MTPPPLRVAAAQAESISGDVEANVSTAVRLVLEAAEADLVALPELFLTGYDPAAWTLRNAVTVDDPRLEPLRDAARETATTVVVGAAVPASSAVGEPGLRLSVLAFGPDGSVTAPYDKQHLFASERAHFVPGDHGTTLVVNGWDVGVGICYDGSFPEHARAAAEAGAQVYLCPSAFFVGSDHRRDLYYAARALDNGMYVVFSGLVGRCGVHEFSGGSAVYDPEGRTLAHAGSDSPAVAFATLDRAELTRTRSTHTMGADRLPTLGGRDRVVVAAARPTVP